MKLSARADMKKLLVLLALLLIFAPRLVRAGDSGAGTDKIEHFGISALCGFGSDILLYTTAKEMGPWGRVATAAAIGLIPGAVKEFAIDARPDAGDMTANVLGAVTGAVSSELLNGYVISASASGKQWGVKVEGKF